MLLLWRIFPFHSVLPAFDQLISTYFECYYTFVFPNSYDSVDSKVVFETMQELKNLEKLVFFSSRIFCRSGKISNKTFSDVLSALLYTTLRSVLNLVIWDMHSLTCTDVHGDCKTWSDCVSNLEVISSSSVVGIKSLLFEIRMQAYPYLSKFPFIWWST